MKKIAIVYDWIDKWGGVERVLLTLHEMFPQATFYTSYYDLKTASWAKNLKIKTSFIQKLPSFIKKSRILSFPFYPFAFEALDFSDYDIVISVTSSFAKSIITKPQTRHICYLLTPTRYLWSHEDVYLRGSLKTLLFPYLSYLKKWDLVAAQRPDKIISISRTAVQRCKKYYKRESEFIYPPFDIEYWASIKSQFPSAFKSQISNLKNYYLVVSRLEPYKKVDLVIKSFNKLLSISRSWNRYFLIIVGEGSEEARLKQIVKGNKESIVFLKKLSDYELGFLYQNAQALIMPQEEDFGYTALEAQFFGCPVIAYGVGGATETILDGKTGLFFNDQTERSFIGVLERFHTMSYNLRTSTKLLSVKNLEEFAKTNFIKKFQTLL